MSSKLVTANEVLSDFADSRIARLDGGWYVRFRSWRNGGEYVWKRWSCKGQDFYPVWHRQWPGGGTASTALSQLIRWLRGQPVLPLSSWQWWASDTCKLVSSEAVQTLKEGGYPLTADCVLCGVMVRTGFDWWNLDGVSGPCCGLRSGCRQNRTK